MAARRGAGEGVVSLWNPTPANVPMTLEMCYTEVPGQSAGIISGMLGFDRGNNPGTAGRGATKQVSLNTWQRHNCQTSKYPRFRCINSQARLTPPAPTG